jgi:hypothetical protein
MFAELLVEVGDGCKPAFVDNFVYLVVGFPEKITSLVGTHLVHIVDKPAAGTA